jgi:hypothetical protein
MARSGYLNRMNAILEPTAPTPFPTPRTSALVGAELRHLVESGALDLPLPGVGRTHHRWAALAALGRCDLALAKLAEGHLDAVAILAEAGRVAVPGARYGVWADGTGVQVVAANGDLHLRGTARFCVGANTLDHALVLAAAPDGPSRLVDIALADTRIHRDPDSRPAIGLDATDGVDVRFDDLPLTHDVLVGAPGWYLTRPGWVLGSGGAAAVWLGGAAGVLDTVLTVLRGVAAVDEHQLAHIGSLYTALRAADTLLADTARIVDTRPELDPTILVRGARSGVERAVREVLDRAPRITGPTPLSRDLRFAQRLADLQLYVRQHQAERDLAALGALVLGAEHDR